jgi:Polyphosphate kinase C-terminal domain 1
MSVTTVGLWRMSAADLAEAIRSGQISSQEVVLVEITARFDEAPNIGWGKELGQAGANVAYGVERVKTHVKLALVVREEPDGIRRYVHVGTGNYHEGTARLYEGLGLLTADRDLSPRPGECPGPGSRPSHAGFGFPGCGERPAAHSAQAVRSHGAAACGCARQTRLLSHPVTRTGDS